MITMSLMFALAQEVASAEASAEAPTDADATEATTGPDRSAPPEVLPPVPVDLDELTVVEIAPGLTLHHVQVDRVRDVFVQITWRHGYAGSGKDPAQVRLASALWGTATEQHDEAELATLEDTMDMTVSSRIGPWTTFAGIELPLEELDEGWEILDQVVHTPKFDKRVLKRTQEELYRYYVTNGPTSPRTLLWAAHEFALYSEQHPDGWRPDVDAFEAVKVKTLKPMLDSFIDGGPVDILVVGDLPLDKAESEVRKRFSDLGGEGERAVPAASDLDKPWVIAVPLPDSEQVSILHSRAAPALGDEDRVPMQVVAYALGGHFLARFNRNLREEKGWTYGVRSFYAAGLTEGRFQVSVDVPADKLAPAVTELNHELKRMVEGGVTPDEIDSGWRSRMKSHNDTRSTTDEAAGVYTTVLHDQRSIAKRLEDVEAFRAVTVEQSQQVATQVFGEPDGVWVFVGPRDALEQGLEALELEATWVKPEDAIVGGFERP